VERDELTARYMEEVDAERAEGEAGKAGPKGGRQPTVKERFVDLPFPTQSSRRTSILERQGRVARGINVERKAM